jgi:hypothetical protein
MRSKLHLLHLLFSAFVLMASACSSSQVQMASVGPQGDAISDREYTLSQTPKDVGLNIASASTKNPKVWGVVMDVHSKDRLLTIVAYSDGTARLMNSRWAKTYISAGHPAVVYTSKKSVYLADSNIKFFSPTTDHGSPPEGYIKIFILSSPSLLSSQNYLIEEISKKDHPLYDLYCVLYDVGNFQLQEPSL